jgi:hypothetical protein
MTHPIYYKVFGHKTYRKYFDYKKYRNKKCQTAFYSHDGDETRFQI